MTRAQLRPVIVVMLLASLVPLGGATAKPQDTPTLTLPVVSTNTTAGATFSGTLTVTRFVARGPDVFAEGIVSGTVKDAGGTPLGPPQVRGVIVPVSGNWSVGKKAMAPGGIVPASASVDLRDRIILAQATTCDILHLSFGPIDLDLLGVMFNLSAVSVDISGDQAGALGALVCAILGVVGSVANLVNLLNNLLGTLTGALGGVV